MNIVFREATHDDLPDVVVLLRDDVLGATRECEELEHYQNAFENMKKKLGNLLIVGETKSEIIATYQLLFIDGLSLSATKRAQIESIRVASDLRGQGIGTLLMQDAVQRATDAGCGLFQLMSNTTRQSTHRFYKKNGFQQTHFGFKLSL